MTTEIAVSNRLGIALATDSAVTISGNGHFVWIKRKHYFQAALNPRYFWRKYGKSPNGGNIDEKQS